MPGKKPSWPKPSKAFDVPLFSGYVYLFTSKAKYLQAYEFLDATPPRLNGVLGRAEEMVNKRNGDIMYLVGWFDDRQSTLTHEAAHVTFFILNTAGIDARDSSGETFCYLLGSILNGLGIK